MALFKCKMCGGDLNITADEKIIECEFCGTTQTIPTSKDENLHGLFNRANILRMKSEFDKAEQLYEKIIEKDETQAEAYWGLILCKYGIEYVEDPQTFKRIPTCHRTSFDSIIADEDYKSALNFADSVQRGIYEAEAKEIDRIQKGILELSQKEEPYDVFICYKETDNGGKRTQDSVIANDIYYQLTQEGLKVFYAAITLENKLGSAYEPCIFAALNSAKVMLAIGTKPEHFNAVWVKNEWSRFLKLMKKDRNKMLIPCYRDMDAYELPEEFSHLQAQDMSKIGFINDIVRGIKKVMAPEEPKQASEKTVAGSSANTASLLERAFMFLEDGEWESADGYCEKVLDIDPKCAEAYLGKLMAETKSKKVSDVGSSIMLNAVSGGVGKYIIKNCTDKIRLIKYIVELMGLGLSEAKNFAEKEPVIMNIPDTYLKEFEVFCKLEICLSRTVADVQNPVKTNKNYEKFVRFAPEERINEINAYISSWEKKKKEADIETLYNNATYVMNTATTEEEFNEAMFIFDMISDYKDSAELSTRCLNKREELLKQAEKKHLEEERILAEQEEKKRLEEERMLAEQEKQRLLEEQMREEAAQKEKERQEKFNEYKKLFPERVAIGNLKGEKKKLSSDISNLEEEHKEKSSGATMEVLRLILGVGMIAAIFFYIGNEIPQLSFFSIVAWLEIAIAGTAAVVRIAQSISRKSDISAKKKELAVLEEKYNEILKQPSFEQWLKKEK